MALLRGVLPPLGPRGSSSSVKSINELAAADGGPGWDCVAVDVTVFLKVRALLEATRTFCIPAIGCATGISDESGIVGRNRFTLVLDITVVRTSATVALIPVGVFPPPTLEPAAIFAIRACWL